MKKLMLALTLSLAFPAAYAQQDTKAAPKAEAKSAALPAFGKEKTIPAPKIAKKVLSNGLEVWVVPRTGLPRGDYVLAVRVCVLSAED